MIFRLLFWPFLPINVRWFEKQGNKVENFSAPDADNYIEFNGRRQCLDRSKCVCSAGGTIGSKSQDYICEQGKIFIV